MANSWFKHYNTASQGESLRALWDGRHMDAYGLYWLILELISRWESPEKRGFLEIKMGVLMRETGWKRDKIERELARLCSDSLSIAVASTFDDRDKIVTIYSSNWLELQETRGGKRRAKTKQKGERSKKEEVRSKKEDSARSELTSLDYPNSVEEIAGALLSNDVAPKLVQSWLDAYGSPSKIITEFKKALAWIEANPKRKPKKFGAFFTNWLARDPELSKPKKKLIIHQSIKDA